MPLEPIFTVAAIITAAGVIIGGIIAIYRVAQRISNSIGLDSKGRTISERLDRVEHQLWPNGGSSLADQIKNASDTTKENHIELKFIKQLLLSSNPNFIYVEETDTDSIHATSKRTRKKAS